jgi:hypothetical protein
MTRLHKRRRSTKGLPSMPGSGASKSISPLPYSIAAAELFPMGKCKRGRCQATAPATTGAEPMSDTAQRKELCHGSVGSSLTFEKRAMAGSKLSLQAARPAACRNPKILCRRPADFDRCFQTVAAITHSGRNYFAVTSECVMAWTESAMRFCTPTLRISFAT